MKFNDLNISANIVKALNELNIIEPTSIQEKAIPLAKSGKDLIGISKTGSGKTAAFGIPILENIKHGNGLQAIIIAPTRELAVQISQEMKKFSKYTKCSIAIVFGGMAMEPQIRAMAKADIVVGTPGRLVDHLNHRNLNLSKINCFVLDEADRMVDMGFITDIKILLDATPNSRQILLFGATISNEINQLKRKYLKNPATAKADLHVKKEFLEQYYYNLEHNEKFSMLVHLLKKENIGRAMIFCSTRATVELVTKNLRLNGIKAEMIHGKLSQNKRLQVMENFNKNREPNILVASAVAARGLHVNDVTHIFNYDLSQDPQEYIHRVGRTARAGETGKAFTLLSSKDHSAFRDILKKFDVKVQLLPNDKFEKLRFQVRQKSFGHAGGRSGHSGRRFGSSSRRPGSNSRGRFGQGRSPKNRFSGKRKPKPIIQEIT